MVPEDSDLGATLEQGRITLRVLLTEDGQHIVGMSSSGLSCLEAHGVLAMALTTVGDPEQWAAVCGEDEDEGDDVEDV